MSLRIKRNLSLVMLALWLLAGCTLISFKEYDYETHEDAHIGIKGVDADVHKVRGGLFLGRKIKFGQPKLLTKKAKPEAISPPPE